MVDISDMEINRLENQHRLFNTLCGKKLIFNDIYIPQYAKILDLGTSSGIWAIEMAEMYPDATVIGLDISPQQTGQAVPPNCSFQVRIVPILYLILDTRYQSSSTL